MIYEQFRVTGTDDSVENYTDLFTIVLRNNDIQEFDSKWDGILLSMTKIPPEDFLEGLYKFRIRESENVTDLLSDGKTPYERRFAQPFEGPIIPFGSLVEYHPKIAKDQSRIHQFGKKVLLGLFLGYALFAVGI